MINQENTYEILKPHNSEVMHAQNVPIERNTRKMAKTEPLESSRRQYRQVTKPVNMRELGTYN